MSEDGKTFLAFCVSAIPTGLIAWVLTNPVACPIGEPSCKNRLGLYVFSDTGAAFASLLIAGIVGYVVAEVFVPKSST